MKTFAPLTALVTLSLTAWPAGAQEGAASGSFALSSSKGATSSAARSDYMTRYRPKAGLVELGMFGGVIFPSKTHNFQQEGRPHQAFKSVAPDLGLRLGYFPLSFLGAEAEGAVMPTKTRDDDGAAGLWALRAHLIGQLPTYSVAPFVLLGGGRMGGGSNAMGSDNDPAFHFGAGVKAPLDDFVMLRLDLRDTLTQQTAASDGTQTHHPEVLLGLSFVIERESKKKPEPPKDQDRDGFVDDADACPSEPGVAPDGCPLKDADNDGFVDPDDQCPEEPGVAPDGCPIRDGDADGILDENDKCPDVPGIAPDGCPDPDPDQDGVLGDADKCPTQPETKNEYEDEDGCPDEIPEKVKQFTGVIEGIEFDAGKATIRAKSKPTLDAAAAVLVEYPKLRVEIIGHTDADGDRDANVALSRARAESVKAYLVEKGVDAARVETRGAGPDEPRAPNDTFANKQMNRRIEFKLLK